MKTKQKRFWGALQQITPKSEIEEQNISNTSVCTGSSCLGTSSPSTFSRYAKPCPAGTTKSMSPSAS